MTPQRKLLATLSIAGIVIGSGCSTQQMVKMAEEQELKVNPSPLELHGDSVSFDVSATLPVNMLKKNRLYTIKTYYTYGDPTQELDQIEFKDTEFPNQKVEQPQQSRHFSFAYEDKMIAGELKIKGLVSNLEKTKFKETPEWSIAKGVITTSRLVKPAFKVVYADHGYNNQEELIPTNVEFFFDKGSSKLNSSEVKGDRGQQLNAFIAAKNVTRTVTIFGGHSPEGLESINSKLAEERATVIKDFYAKQMKMYDYKNLADSIKFETKAIFQDWAPFKAALDDSSSSLTPEEKAQIIAIVDGQGSSYLEKEKELAKLSSYKKLTKEVYPKLRISKTQILSVKPKKTDAEISVLAKSIVNGSANADTLKMDELLYAATLTPLMDEKEGIYLAATKKESNWVAHNNLGAVYLDQAIKASQADKAALLEKATAQFNIAATLKETATTLNNKGIVELFSKDKEAASATFTKALGANPSAETKKGIEAGLGSAEIMKGNYAEAINKLGNASDVDNATFNLGLAQLLNKDFTNAEKSFESAAYINKTDALAYYCSAIVASRQGNVENVAIELKEAIKLDAKLADKALNDLEFVNYWQNETFINALK